MILLRDLLIFIVGLGVGSLINAAIYGLAYDWRPISPWLTPAKGNPKRIWLDCLPIVGWILLRREEKIHGRWFWIRPLLIELAYAAGMVWLFHFETNNGLLSANHAFLAVASDWYPMFAVHAVLIALLTAATFIDFDELMIPDAITLWGAILLLIMTTAMPTSHLPSVFNKGGLVMEPLLLHSKPEVLWPNMLDEWQGLAIGLGILWLWWAAIQHGTATLRYGWLKSVSLYIESLVRLRPKHRPKYRNLLPAQILLFVLMSAATAAVWFYGGKHWHSLLTSLVGLGTAGGLVWAVRVGGWIGLRKEAMGFGDATLMTMVGVALGWQASLLVFFVSPFAAVIIAVLNAIITRRPHIPFGPYLSLAAVIVIVAWVALWEHYSRDFFAMPGLVPSMLVSFILAMTGLLWLWRLIKPYVLTLIFGPEIDDDSESKHAR
ncbi:prepilin peptidase [Anatilimnocola floriformis]|uniref:prepilin peptidase n=1 Tax=Anatilimnocola floriformis TaxID=2948575 RepID=UPI0020C3FC1C|nr:A24 family peptidase [Anatilimnocola floriformis]